MTRVVSGLNIDPNDSKFTEKDIAASVLVEFGKISNFNPTNLTDSSTIDRIENKISNNLDLNDEEMSEMTKNQFESEKMEFFMKKIEDFNEENYKNELTELKNEKQKYLDLSTKLTQLEINVDRDTECNLILHEAYVNTVDFYSRIYCI